MYSCTIMQWIFCLQENMTTNILQQLRLPAEAHYCLCLQALCMVFGPWLDLNHLTGRYACVKFSIFIKLQYVSTFCGNGCPVQIAKSHIEWVLNLTLSCSKSQKGNTI